MALGDHCLEPVETVTGAKFLLSVCAVEPVADIAVLAAPDNQSFFDDAKAFEEFCEATAPVRVSRDDFERDVDARVHVWTHRGEWIEGGASEPGGPSGGAWLQARRHIEGGTSGSPVVSDAGLLVGLVSWSEERTFDGRMPRPHHALPSWVWHQIDAAQRATSGLSTGRSMPSSALPPQAPSAARAMRRKSPRTRS
jgi:hypothetical protein